MGKKVRTNLYIDSSVLKEAQEMGLNISKTCENALKMAIAQLQPLYTKKNLRNVSNDTPNTLMAGGVGFEPTTTGLGGLSPILTRLPALDSPLFRHVTKRLWSPRA
jgi:hypothetical protein